jgi:hypothetical protein
VVTWMQIIAEVQRVDAKRKRGEHFTQEDTERLITMLLDFHRGTVLKVPEPSRPQFRGTGTRKLP